MTGFSLKIPCCLSNELRKLLVTGTHNEFTEVLSTFLHMQHWKLLLLLPSSGSEFVLYAYVINKIRKHTICNENYCAILVKNKKYKQAL